MKLILPALIVAFAPSVFADVTVSKNRGSGSAIHLSVTGEDAVALKNIVLDYEGVSDAYLKGVNRKSNDSSALRFVLCKKDEDSCAITLSGHETLTNADTQEYYNEKLNERLKTLKGTEVLVLSSMGRGSNGTPSVVDSRFLRLMMEKSSSEKAISVATFKTKSMTNPDVLSSKLYEVKMATKNMTITCSSSIVTGMGVINLLEEGCSVDAKAEVK